MLVLLVVNYLIGLILTYLFMTLFRAVNHWHVSNLAFFTMVIFWPAIWLYCLGSELGEELDD